MSKTNYFKSRKLARQFKSQFGGKLVDCGAGCGPVRWQVIQTNEKDYSNTIVIITPQNVLVTLEDGTQYNVNRDKGEFSKVVHLALEENYKEMMKYVDLANAVQIFTFGTDIYIENGMFYFKGENIDNSLSKRIVEESTKTSGNVQKYINFFRKLYKNPSFKAVQHTYDFMVHNDLEILEDGNIKAWKSVSVSADGIPVAAKGVPNWKNTTIEMPRNEVEDNPHVTCSYGLHVAGKEYAEGFADHLLEVSVSPEDIVSVPVDYKNQKCRACKYKILTGFENKSAPNYLLVNKHGVILDSKFS